MKDGWQLELLKAMLVLLTAPEFRNILKVLMKNAVNVPPMLLETLSWLDKELLQLLRTGSSKISINVPSSALAETTPCRRSPSTRAPGRRR